ncbi:hypothetical protein HPP92_009286 [Vanilla planifolia]|uniref:Uncharacterized protein n=1 Tax=Vanilla planifolia TaxID=51239 RepID=A0A835R7J7_VANPL|nr:hypothetical protein HPP92_009286 [Vanilla planifolia]
MELRLVAKYNPESPQIAHAGGGVAGAPSLVRAPKFRHSCRPRERCPPPPLPDREEQNRYRPIRRHSAPVDLLKPAALRERTHPPPYSLCSTKENKIRAPASRKSFRPFSILTWPIRPGMVDKAAHVLFALVGVWRKAAKPPEEDGIPVLSRWLRSAQRHGDIGRNSSSSARTVPLPLHGRTRCAIPLLVALRSPASCEGEGLAQFFSVSRHPNAVKPFNSILFSSHRQTLIQLLRLPRVSRRRRKVRLWVVQVGHIVVQLYNSNVAAFFKRRVSTVRTQAIVCARTEQMMS